MKRHLGQQKNEFTIEIIEHYPDLKLKNPKYTHKGTFHAYWEEMDMDFRGIEYFIAKYKDPWLKLPGGRGKLGQENCSFTFYAFGDMRKMKRFMMAMREAFYVYWRKKKADD